MHHVIFSNEAPAAIGPYSQAIQAGKTVYLSGQLGLHPETLQLVEGGVAAQAEQMFQNLKAVAKASGGTLSNIVKLTLFLTSMADFSTVNQVMERFFSSPFPARSCLAVKELPKQALAEVEAILVLDEL